MFGGFDGEFYNDLHILHMKKDEKSKVSVRHSELDESFAKLVNEPELADIIFELEGGH